MEHRQVQNLLYSSYYNTGKIITQKHPRDCNFYRCAVGLNLLLIPGVSPKSDLSKVHNEH